MEKKTFKTTFLGKILKWFSLAVFTFSFMTALFLYNVSTELNEKNIKAIGSKIVSQFLEENKDLIQDNYGEIISFAKAHPLEELQFPTGIADVALNLKGEVIADLSQEEFFKQVPELTVNQFFDNTRKLVLAKENSPEILKNQFFNEKSSGRYIENLFYAALIIMAISLISYFFLNNKKKFVFNIGVIILFSALPAYLLFYLLMPFLTSIIRELNFFVAANMISDLFGQVQKNYLYASLSGLFIAIIGIIIQGNLKEIIPRKKGQYEKVIRVK